MPGIPALGSWGQKGEEFKVIFLSVTSLRPAWARCDCHKTNSIKMRQTRAGFIG